MKKLLLLASCTLGFVACSTKEEPINIVVPEVSVDTQTLVSYKAKSEGRGVVVAMHYDWGTKPGFSLINTPDSLDIVVLKNNYDKLSEMKLKDLKEVQQRKGTKVMPSIDIESVSESAQKAITVGYKTAKKAQDAAWAEDGSKPKDPQAVSQVYQEIKERVQKEEVEKAQSWLESQIKAVDQYLGALGFDGISVRLPQTDAIFAPEVMQSVLDKLNAVAGLEKSKMLIVESPVEQYKDKFASANFLVLYQPGLSDFPEYQALIERYSDHKLLFAYDLNDADLKKGFKNLSIFSPSETQDKGQILVDYKHSAKAGVAVYHSEKYYFSAQEYQGFVNPYEPLKAIINMMAQHKK